MAWSSPVLNLRLLGEIEIARDGRQLTLPPSKKTRALLAYLAMNLRPHRRERLCSLFWEVPDDPRGALRWSLSRLRALVDEPGRHRIVANRETVAFEPLDAEIDVLKIRATVDSSFPGLSTEQLHQAAAAFHGEFLEGIDLPNLHDFQAWCLAEREDLRRLQARILTVLVGRLAERPEAALPHARQLVQIDPFNEAGRISLLQLLMTLGRRGEAEQHFEIAVRVIKELGPNAEFGLVRSWRELRERSRTGGAPAETATIAPAPILDPKTDAEVVGHGDGPRTLVGREREWNRLVRALDAAVAQRKAAVALIVAEPGLGKTRMIEDLLAVARQRGVHALSGRAYEAESTNPYGPWIEAIGAFAAPETNRDDPDTTPLPEEGGPAARQSLFDRASRAIFTDGERDRPVLIVLDDVQWCDEASADLLHHVIRGNRQRPLLVVLAARDGELADNMTMLGVLRSLRHDRLLQEIRLAPLTPAESETLLAEAAPGVDAARIAAQCGGNPLFAIELARDSHARPGELPQSLKELIRDRIDRLDKGADLLRWASVVGTSFSVNRLLPLTPLSLDELMERLEILERHALLRPAASDGKAESYRFAHDLIHQAVYTGISEPRRRLMHLKVARTLQEAHATDETLAADIAHHAALGGDPGMAAAACVRAGRRSLRLFANAQAEAMARNGLRYAESLMEPERVQRMLELRQIEILARRPADPAQTIDHIQVLADRALDHGCVAHARLGFHLLSYLRWEEGRWSDAERDTLRAELVSRSADDKQRVIAMAEAARCLAMLERDLGQAETLALEASALASRFGFEPSAIADAIGMLRHHQGDYDEAARRLRHARELARLDGDRASEFLALEHHVTLEIQRARFEEAESLCAELTELAEKLRTGSEVPFALALHATCRMARANDPSAEADLDSALAALRVSDAKHRLAFTLLSAASLHLQRGDRGRAKERADEALRMAIAIERPSEIALAHSLLARIATEDGDQLGHKRHADALRKCLILPLSRHARAIATAALDRDKELPASPAPVPHARPAGTERTRPARPKTLKP